MAGLIRSLIALVVLAFIAKTIERKRHSAQADDATQWPAWNQGASTPGESASNATVPEPEPEPVSVAASESWSAPIDGDCPPGFPVKVKLSSRIYHVEGMMHWGRLHADRCYSSTVAAEADGFRASKM